MNVVTARRCSSGGPCWSTYHWGGAGSWVYGTRWQLLGNTICDKCFERFKCENGAVLLPPSSSERTTQCPRCHGLRYFNGGRDACPNCQASGVV